MIKKEGNGKFERLPSIRDTVINGSLLLTIHDQNDQKREVKVGYEQGKESKIYKRTRLNGVSPRQMKKWPASLLLSGKKVFDPTTGSISQTSEVEDVKTIDSEHEQLPPIVDSDKIVLLEPSKSFYSDFGLKTHNTDTFNGYIDMRKKRHKSSSFVKKEIEKKAMKHIHAIQVLSNSKRGSYAIRSVNALKETLGPARTNTEIMLPTSYVRSEINVPQERHQTFVDVSKKAPYNMLIRTRDGNTRVVTRRDNPLPEISGRTVLGFETKYTNSQPPMKEYI